MMRRPMAAATGPPPEFCLTPKKKQVLKVTVLNLERRHETEFASFYRFALLAIATPIFAHHSETPSTMRQNGQR